MSNIASDTVDRISKDYNLSVCAREYVENHENEITDTFASIALRDINATKNVADEKIDEVEPSTTVEPSTSLPSSSPVSSTQTPSDTTTAPDEGFDWGSGYMIAIYVLTPILIIIIIESYYTLRRFYNSTNNYPLNDDIGDIAPYKNTTSPNFEDRNRGIQMAERGHKRSDSRHQYEKRFQDQSRRVRVPDVEDGFQPSAHAGTIQSTKNSSRF